MTWAQLREKKYNQIRTGQQKSHKSVKNHIFGGKLPVKNISMKFGTGVYVHEVVMLAEFDLENLRGVHFTGG